MEMAGWTFIVAGPVRKMMGKKRIMYLSTWGTRMENGVAIPLFEDQGKKLGIDDNSNTDHNCFFDYDRDGDLDLFLLSHKTNFF
jgi:hypothetical protein